jgi:hypothetical protein
MKRQIILAIIILFTSLGLCIFSARLFFKMRQPEPIIPGEGVSQIKALSDYFQGIKNSRGDTEVYILEGETPGGTTLILGGTHPNEPGGFITAVCLIENLKVTQGKIIIIPRANNSAFTHNDPQEGNPQRFIVKTPKEDRWFRFGSRSTNPIDQWPDPEVYLHYPSRQKLSGSETRNLNRSYPGRPDGSLTEKVAFAIMQLMKTENVNIGIDLHEASLEYPVINAIVAHPLAFELAGETVIYLQMEGININLEPSPENFRGLSHREWGDHLNIYAVLMETANTVQGRYHGRLTDDMVVTGKDRFYYEAAQHGLLEVDYSEQGIPLKVRVGRHLTALKYLYQVWNERHPDQGLVIENIPDYQELQEKDVGAFLN